MIDSSNYTENYILHT